ncbi:MAG: hypothetical protein Q4D88_04400 [Anaerococcus sp.]|nr:hypothetical protein [Anaerococcus sp.]
MKDQYINLNSQYLFNKFKIEYDKKYKSNNDKSSNDLKSWLRSYCKSDLVSDFILVLISTFIGSLFFKGSTVHKYIYIASIPIFILLSLLDYYLDFSSEEKTIANEVIDQIFSEEGIVVSEQKLDTIIKNSKDVGSRKTRIFNQIKTSKLYTTITTILGGFLGIILGYFTSYLSNSSENKIVQNLVDLSILFFLVALYFMIFYILYLSITKAREKYKNLYIQVLEDKKLTLILTE